MPMFEKSNQTSLSDFHRWPQHSKERQHDNETQRREVSTVEPDLAPATLLLIPKPTRMISEGTQNEMPEIKTDEQSSSTDSTSPHSPFAAWTNQFHHHEPAETHTSHARDPTSTYPSSTSLEIPQRPMTPRADLYHGQTSANFGMTFEKRSATGWRNESKPPSCANNYEDQKHRMMMKWLERRDTV